MFKLLFQFLQDVAYAKQIVARITQTQLGLEIKSAGRRTFEETFVAGYSNDYLGYFLTRRDFGQPSYVACGSLYGERGGEIVRDAAVELLGRLAETRTRG